MVYWKCDNSSYLPLDSDNKNMGFYRNENYRPNFDLLNNQTTRIGESSSINDFKAVSVISSNGYYGYVGNPVQQQQQQQINGPVKRKEKEENGHFTVKRMRIEQPEQEINGGNLTLY